MRGRLILNHQPIRLHFRVEAKHRGWNANELSPIPDFSSTNNCSLYKIDIMKIPAVLLSLSLVGAAVAAIPKCAVGPPYLSTCFEVTLQARYIH